MNLKTILAIAAVFLLPTLAHGETSNTKSAYNSYPSVTTFDTESVASGAVVTLQIDTTYSQSMHCTLRTSNEAGGGSRLYIPTETDSRGIVQYTYPTTTVATNSDHLLIWDPDMDYTNLGSQTDVTIYPYEPPRFFKMTAAGANGVTQATCTYKSH